MLLNLLLASQFWLMSDRADFFDADKISHQTHYMETGDVKSESLNTKEIEGKNVLLLVHGYNSSEEVLSTYRLINTHVSEFYDLVIGYLWPGNDEFWEYFDAKKHVKKLASKMKSHLEILSSSAAKVDVLAHSMGNFLILEALDYPSNTNKKIIRNFYSLAPSVDDESIEKKEKYFHSTENCEKIFVFYSKRDSVLKIFYSLAEGDKALGYEGAQDFSQLPQNVELVNYTKFIGEHSQYFAVLPLYEFMKNHAFSGAIPEDITKQKERSSLPSQ